MPGLLPYEGKPPMRLSIRARRTASVWAWAVAMGWIAPGVIGAEPPAPDEAPAVREEPVLPPAAGGFRKLAPGVVRSVDPARQLEETVSRHDQIGLLSVNADYTWAKNVRFRHNVWCLEFKYKPVRTIWVDVPQQNGVMQRKLIWYLVYSVTNTGQTMTSEKQEDGTYQVKTVQEDVRFVPEFILFCRKMNKAYPEKVIPVAVPPIRLREDPNRRFYNTAEMLREIKVGETVWGVATWEDVDPRVDAFSVYVKGLTNAYKWDDNQAAYKPGDPVSGRKIGVKTLKLNFWRPGDEHHGDQDLVRTGIPSQTDTGASAHPEHEWVYLY